MGFLSRQMTNYFLNEKPLRVDSELCVKAKSPLAMCERCANVCPHDALSYENRLWVVDDQCNECGFCVSSCPMGAFSFSRPMIEAVDGNTKLCILTCQHDPQSSGMTNRLPCFQSLRMGFFAELALRYEQVILCVSCENCDKKWYPESFFMQVDRYSLEKEQFCYVSTLDELGLITEDELSRRYFMASLLKRTGHSGKKIAEDMVEQIEKNYPIDNEEDGNIDSPVRHEQEILSRYYQEHINISEEKEIPFPRLANRGCHFCEACVKLCPTKSLMIEKKEKNKNLLYNPVSCVRCGICKDICMDKGFIWENRLTIRDLKSNCFHLLIEGEAALCSECQESFFKTNDDSMCYICKKKA